jgi:hypothetical protein
MIVETVKEDRNGLRLTTLSVNNSMAQDKVSWADDSYYILYAMCME